LDAGRIGFAEVATGKRLPLIHPGKILRDDFLLPMNISAYTLAQAIKVPRSRVNDIVLGRRDITADTAFRLARYFGTTPDFWINLQARYDVDAAERKLRRRIEREVRPRAAGAGGIMGRAYCRPGWSVRTPSLHPPVQNAPPPRGADQVRGGLSPAAWSLRGGGHRI
jgi:addiction module HigA family antidote